VNFKILKMRGDNIEAWNDYIKIDYILKDAIDD